VLLGLRLPRVDAEQPARGEPQVPVQAGLCGDDAAQLGPLVPAELVRPIDELPELGDQAGAGRGVSFGAFRVAADDEPLILGDADLLDAQVADGDLSSLRVVRLPRCRAR